MFIQHNPDCGQPAKRLTFSTNSHNWCLCCPTLVQPPLDCLSLQMLQMSVFSTVTVSKSGKESPQSFLSSKHLYVYTYKLLTVTAIANHFFYQGNKGKLQYGIIVKTEFSWEFWHFQWQHHRWILLQTDEWCPISQITIQQKNVLVLLWSAFSMQMISFRLKFADSSLVAYCVASEVRVLYHKLVIAWCQIAPHLIPCHSKL